MRSLAYVLSLAVVVVAAFVVPMPLVDVSPGQPVSITSVLRGEELPGTITGDYQLVSVDVTRPTLAGIVRAALTADHDLTLRSHVIPADLDDEEWRDSERERFESTGRTAIAVGLTEAGYGVELITAAIVSAVLPHGPSGGTLETGDLLLAVDDRDVTSATDLIAELRGTEVGDRIDLRILRDDDELVVTVEAGVAAGMDGPGLGILVDDAVTQVRLPLALDLASTTTGHASAGLLIALAAYDLASSEDLARGRLVAGIGTVDRTGRISRVGGIKELVRGADAAGADIILVPSSQLADARRVSSRPSRVHGVETVVEALELLQRGPTTFTV